MLRKNKLWIVFLRSQRKDLNVRVLDCDHGLGIIRRGKSENGLEFGIKEIEKMSYEDLVTDRRRLLNLAPPEFVSGLE